MLEEDVVDQGVDGDDLGGAGALLGQLGHHQHLAHGVQLGAAVGLRHVQGGEADLRHLLDDLLGDPLLLVDLGRDGRQLALGKVPGQLLNGGPGQLLNGGLVLSQMKSHGKNSFPKPYSLSM